jgi:hypothetical protein
MKMVCKESKDAIDVASVAAMTFFLLLFPRMIETMDFL